MTLLAKVTFAVLVAATGGAFFVTQRLKRSPPLVTAAAFRPRAFSPNGDGVLDRARLSFKLKQADDVTVSIVTLDGDPVRTLATAVYVPAHHRYRARWNGRDDDGRRAPNGLYRARIGLRRQGRTVTLPGIVRLDVRPPGPRITAVAGVPAARARTPTIVTAGRAQPLVVRFGPPTKYHRPELLVSRTDLARPGIVARVAGRRWRRRIRWDGRVDGRPPPAGVYRLQIREVDRAGNVGLSPPRARGIGVTVRALAAQVPLAPARPGARVTVFVDVRGRAYDWALARIGERGAVARGRGRGPRLRVRLPRGPSGLFLLTLRAGGARLQVPLLADAAQRRPVLVVLPALRWLAEDAVDDDGDGVPNTLDRGQRVPLLRPFAALPAGLAREEGALLAHLDGAQDRYELTTDAALALGQGPPIEGHRGVLLAGAETWVTPALAARLRRFATGGGSVASFAVRSLRRRTRIAGGALVDPTPLAARDAFGARLGPLVARPVSLTAFGDGFGLFDTTDGDLGSWPAFERTLSAAPGRLVADAGPNPATPVVVGIALGRGRVIRAGVPGWAARIGRDVNVTGLTDRAWELLSR